MSGIVGSLSSSKMSSCKPALVAIAAFACGCEPAADSAGEPEACTEPWLILVENLIQSADSQGHGPDIGSLEWRSVVEFKLGIRGDPDIPDRESDDWCQFIDDYISRRQE